MSPLFERSSLSALRLVELAQSVQGKYKVAARCLDKHGRVLSVATNSYAKTHPTQSKWAGKAGFSEKQFLHAEIAALVKALRTKQQPYKIQVIRVNNLGELRMAKPCPICSMAIKEAGIKFVEYST